MSAPDTTRPSASKTTYPTEETIVLGDQFVIQHDSRPVLSALREWGVPTKGVTSDRLLGLSLVDLDAAQAVPRVLEALKTTEAELMRRATDGYQPLDVVMTGLREHFRERNVGWIPTLGKNRMMHRVVQPAQRIQFGGQESDLDPSQRIQFGDDGVPFVLSGVQMHDRGGDVPTHALAVGLLDSVLVDHPWLAGGYVGPKSGIDTSHRPLGEDVVAGHHATFVAGLILRQNPETMIVHRRILGADGSTDTWDLAVAVAALADAGVRLINLSMACLTEDAEAPLVLSVAANLLGSGSLLVVAAGNHADEEGVTSATAPPSWPAALPNVVAVGSMDGDEVASFSPSSAWIDAYAPGVSLVSSFGYDERGRPTYARASGTSFSAAAVTGATARCLRDHPELTPREAFNEVRGGGADPAYITLRAVDGWPGDGPQDTGSKR